MKTKLEVKLECAACGATRKKNELLYDPNDLKAYCSNIGSCNDKHPNSYSNFADRKSLIELVPYSEAAEVFRNKFLENADRETLEAFDMTEKPTTVRFSDLELAKYVLKLRSERGLNSMNAVLMDIVKDHMTMMQDSEAIVHSGTVLEQKQEEIAEQQERIEDLKAVNKPVYTPEDDNEDVI